MHVRLGDKCVDCHDTNVILRFLTRQPKAPLMATSNSPTFGQVNSPRQCGGKSIFSQIVGEPFFGDGLL